MSVSPRHPGAAAPHTRNDLYVTPDDLYITADFSKVTRRDVEAAFADGWRIDSVEPSAIDLTDDPGHVRGMTPAVSGHGSSP